MTPAEELTAAADKLDALAAKTTYGAWRFDSHTYDAERFGSGWDVDGPHGGYIARLAAKGDAAYIAAMNPLGGKALAQWLRYEAETLASDPSDYCGERSELDDECGDWYCGAVDRALEIARLINGGGS